MSETPLPPGKAVRDLFIDLFGRDVDLAPSEPVVPAEDAPAAIAVYVDDRQRMTAVAAADLALSARAAAAIGLVPPAGAEAAEEDGELSPMLCENLYEVFNILGSLFSAEGAPHLRLYAMYAPGDLPPTDVSEAVREYGRRLDQAVGIRGYGQGRLSLVLPA